MRRLCAGLDNLEACLVLEFLSDEESSYLDVFLRDLVFLEIALIADDQSDNILARVLVNFLHPLLDVVEAFLRSLPPTLFAKSNVIIIASAPR